MSKQYILLINNTCSGQVFKGFDSVRSYINDWSKGKKLVDEEDNEIKVEDLIGEESQQIWVDEMCERGDDFVDLAIVKLIFE